MQFDIQILRRCWFLAGPTACGKTATALYLAEQLRAEIVSLDSMAIYRGMDIGTAKPTPAEQKKIPHHLINLRDPYQEFSLAEYLDAVSAACRKILDRDQTPLFVGGTGLYLRGLLRGVFQGPSADWPLRHRLEAEAALEGSAAIHARLRQIDPASAEAVHPNDLRRIIRALEVFELTGRPLSEQQQQPPLPIEQRPRHVYWLSPPRDWLYDRINRRVDQMIEEGLIDEVRNLLRHDPPPGRTARQALGYKEIISHLEGSSTLEEAIETIKTRTRQFAKRQHTWFRNLEECQAIEITGEETPAEIAGLILPCAADS